MANAGGNGTCWAKRVGKQSIKWWQAKHKEVAAIIADADRGGDLL